MECLYTSAFDYVYVYLSVWASGQARKSGSASYTLKVFLHDGPYRKVIIPKSGYYHKYTQYPRVVALVTDNL